MSFLKVNGVAVPVAVDAADVEPQVIGTEERTESGDLVVDFVREVNTFSVTTTLITKAEAFALKCLVQGLGHVWSFASSLYSSKGRGPASSTNATQGSGGAVSGTGKLTLGATTGSIVFAAATALRAGQDNAEYSILVWRYESGAWHHYIITAAATYRDGVAYGGSTSWVQVFPNGDVQLSNSTGSAVDYSDLVTLPFTVPASWIAGLDAFIRTAGNAFPALSRVRLEGDLVPAAFSSTARGKVEREHVRVARIDGVLERAARTLQLRFSEV
jgi:hypothetical protein